MKARALDSNDPFLDGDSEDFPRREEAMAEYRALWLDFPQGHSEPGYIGDRPGPVESSRRRMDDLQRLISRGPGRVWREFTDTLPGYKEWWFGSINSMTSQFPRASGEEL